MEIEKNTVSPALRDAQDEMPAGCCAKCRGEIWRGESVFSWYGRVICLDCFKAEVNDMLSSTPVALAAMMGLDCREVPA